MKAGYAAAAGTAWFVVAILLAAAPATAQQSDEEWLRSCERGGQRADRAVACQVRPLTTQLAAGALHVDAGQNGGISVRGGSQGSVRVSARIQAQADSDVRAWEIADAVRVATANGRIRAAGIHTYSGESWSVSYHIEVPDRADLELTAVNGPLAVRDVTGRIRASTTNGPLALENLAGDVYARAQNGPLSVRLSGSRWQGAGLDAETRNGPVTLSLPDGYSAQLEAATANGPFTSRIPLTLQGDLRRGGQVSTTLGSGGPTVRVATTNGPLTIGAQR
jgi:DUF4097 and DUF4098 domain-containing protein YvlB